MHDRQPAPPSASDAPSEAAPSKKGGARSGSRSRTLPWLAVAPAAVLIVAVAALALRAPTAIAQRAADYTVLNPVVDVNQLVQRYFFEDPDERAMRTGAITGMLDALDDPFTEYIPPADVAEFEKQIRGSFVGIGAEVEISPRGFLRIVSPLDDSPALEAGLQSGDVIVGVDGASTWRKPINDIIAMLAGEPNTDVTVTVERVGDASDLPPNASPPSIGGPIAVDEDESGVAGEAPGPIAEAVRFDLDITRRRVQASTVRGLHRSGDEWLYFADPERRIAYVRVSQFTDQTRQVFPRVMRSLVADGLRGFVLDLRGNAGGSLDAAVEMADLFLDSGTIVSMRGRAAPERTFAADAPGTLPDFPMVVMVNGASASASEIVAGALADNDRALVLGERSFGKGLVQSVIPLPNNAGTLKLTEAHYYLPSGRNIQREDDSPTWGVDPSDGYYVPMTGEEYGRMWRIRQQEEIRRAEPDSDRARWEDPAWIRERLEDPQLAAAVRAIGAKLATGEWLRTGEDVPEFAIEFAALKSERRRFEALQREAERTARRIQALSDLPGGDEVEASDLLPDELDLSGGLVEIRDESGAVVAQLRITGQGLERWLMEAPVEKMEPAAAAEADAEPQASGE